MVHFVGAGPGAQDLITLRGKEFLANANVVIYAGSLVNPLLLGFCREDCKIYNSAELTLEDIIKIIEDAEKEHLNTVRLHTGDPSIYGAIKEQIAELQKRNISYDITPGVSSFCGAAAAVEAEYTLPGISQTVIITRMAGKTPVPERESLINLAQHGATMVIFLSASMLSKVQNALLQGAYTEQTPCAIVYKATWPEEKIIRTPLGLLAEAGEKNQIRNTALILVGDFLSSDFDRSCLYDGSFSTAYREASH